ncbi:MAG TPA: aminotransferase class IV [Ignavibacteriaceae bacterium]
MIIYFNKKYTPNQDACVLPFDRAFLFADGVYEALRTYNKKLYRLQDHLDRLQYSLHEVNISFKDLDQIEVIAKKLADVNNIKSDFSIYIQISRGISFPRSHNYEPNLTPNVFAFIKPIKDNSKETANGVKVILEKDLRWLRCDIKSTSLLPSVMVNQNAIRNNAYEAILYRDNFITEGSHTNFFAVKDDIVYTAPLSNYILSGVTRKVVLELCKENNIDFREEYINVSKIKEYDEFFITGTTTEIIPVIQIDDWTVKNGKPGNMTSKIQLCFFNSVNQY